MGSDKIPGCERKREPVHSLVCGECMVELSLFYRNVLSVGRFLPPRHPFRIHKETTQPAAKNWSWLVKLED